VAGRGTSISPRKRIEQWRGAFGWVGFEPKHVSAGRIGGMGLVLAGAAPVRFF